MAGLSIHLAVPFRIEGDHAATVEDGSDEEIRQNVEVIITTRRDQRTVLPEFGIGDPVFGTGGRTPDPVEIERAVDRWDPRARLRFEPTDPADDGGQAFTIRVSREEI